MIVSVTSAPLWQSAATYPGKGMSGSTIPGDRRVSVQQSTVTLSDAAIAKLATERQSAGEAGPRPLPEGVRHMLEKMVDDPAYGASYAEGYANNIHTACMTLPAFMQSQGILEAGRGQLQGAWQDIQSQGKSPAEGYAMLLKYELSMPQSYWDAQDPDHTADVRALAQAKLDYLDQYLAASK